MRHCAACHVIELAQLHVTQTNVATNSNTRTPGY